MTVIFADTETLNAHEGRARGVEDKIRVRVLSAGKKSDLARSARLASSSHRPSKNFGGPHACCGVVSNGCGDVPTLLARADEVIE
jgi:hypothetical protein